MDWVDEPVLVHVGLHKTATTWLQTVYFPSPNSGFWYPNVATTNRRAIKEVGYWLTENVRGQLIADDEFDARYFRDKLLHLQKPAGRVAVVSNERLAGHPFSGGFDRLSIAERIKRLFPKAKILVTIRSQQEILVSNYMQYLRYGGWHGPEDFLLSPADTRMPSLNLSFWNYERLLVNYESVFGSGNVLLLPQELLRTEPVQFVETLAKFAGTPQNTAINFSLETNLRKPVVSGYLLRRLTALSRKSHANAFAPSIFPATVGRAIDKGAKLIVDLATPRTLEKRVTERLRRRIIDAIGDYYKESNRRFAAQQTFDLQVLGYKM